MKKLTVLFVTCLWLSCLNQAMAIGFNFSIGDKPKSEKLSPAELNKHVETLKTLKDSAPAQAFEKLSPEQTEKVLLTAIREGHKKEENPIADVLIPIV
ncbi:MAG: hypothetical protein AABY86_04440, partial [Bdellovibrionota bacterium]